MTENIGTPGAIPLHLVARLELSNSKEVISTPPDTNAVMRTATVEVAVRDYYKFTPLTRKMLDSIVIAEGTSVVPTGPGESTPGLLLSPTSPIATNPSIAEVSEDSNLTTQTRRMLDSTVIAEGTSVVPTGSDEFLSDLLLSPTISASSPSSSQSPLNPEATEWYPHSLSGDESSSSFYSETVARSKKARRRRNERERLVGSMTADPLRTSVVPDTTEILRLPKKKDDGRDLLYVIEYTRSSTVEDLYRQLQGAPLSWWRPTMSRFGVPDYMISKVCTYRPRNRATRSAPILASEVTPLPRIAPLYVAQTLPKRLDNEPKRPSLLDGPKIAYYYGRWAVWKMTRLQDHLDKLVSEGRAFAKRGYIYRNKHATLLMYGRLTEKQMRHYLPTAKIELLFEDRRSYAPHKTKVQLCDYLPGLRTINILGGISTKQDWLSLEAVFRRHKPFWRMGVRFFDGELSPEDELKLHSLSEKIRQEVYAPEQEAIEDPESSGEDFPPLRPITPCEPDLSPEELQTCWTSLRYQGAASSVSRGVDPSQCWNVMHHHTLPEGTIQELHRLLQAFGEVLTDKVKPAFTRFATRFSSLMVALMVADTWTQYGAAFLQYLAGSGYLDNPLSLVTSMLAQLPAIRQWRASRPPISVWNDIEQEWEERPPNLQWQGASAEEIPAEVNQDDGGELPSWFITKLLSTLWKELSAVFSSIPEQTSAVVCTLIDSMKISMTRTIGSNMAQYLIECITTARDRLLLAIEERDLSLLFSQSVPPARLIRYALGVRDNYAKLVCQDNKQSREVIAKLVADGCIPPWVAPGSFDDWVKRAETISVDLGIAMRNVSQVDSMRIPLAQAKNELDRFISAHKSGRGSKTRMQPAYLYFYGVPGCGKTHLAEHVISSLQLAMGTKWGLHSGGAAIATYGVKENFQSGIKPETWAVNFNDVDAPIKSISGDTLDPVQYIAKMVDTVPFENESAVAEEKGGNFIEPMLVIQTSNFPDSCAKDSIKDPEVLFRRMTLRFHVKPRPEYATTPDGKNQTRLRTQLAQANRTFDTIYMDIDKFVDGKWTMIAEGVRVSQALKIAHTYCDAWWTAEKSRIEQVHTHGFCPQCYLPNHMSCSCAVPEVEATLSGLPVPRVPATLVRQGRFGCPSLGLPTWVSERIFGGPLEQFETACFKTLETLVRHAGKISFFFALLITAGRAYTQRQARVNNATEISPGYIRADGQRPLPLNVKSPSTWTKDGMIDVVRRNFLEVRNPRTKGMMYALMVSGGVALVPTHVGQSGDLLQMRRCNDPNGRVTEVRLVPPNYCLLQDTELMLVRNTNLPSAGNVLKFFTPGPDASISSYDELAIFGPDGIKYSSSMAVKMALDTHVRLFSNQATQDGDCGLLYAVRHGTAWKIAGMHFGYISTVSAQFSGSACVAALVGYLEVNKLIESQLKVIQMQAMTIRSTFSRDGQSSTTNYERNSNVWNAITNGAELYSYGRLYPSIAGVSPRTRIVPSLLHDQVLETFTEVSHGQFGPPDFKTRQDSDGVWKNPIYHALMDTNHVDLDELDIVCIWDYLSDFYAADVGGYNVLSLSDAVVGIPGSFLHGVNMATSIGPPLMGPKDKHIDIFLDEAHLSPDLYRQIQEIESCLDDKCIPQVMATMTLKDEVLKTGKVARAFYNLPAAANIVAKRYLGPVRAFMQSNTQISECMVGIDMTNATAFNALARRLKLCQYHYYDMDAKALDRSVNAASLYKVGVVFYALAHLIGCDPWRAFAMILMMREALVNVTGDLVNTQWNLSGHDATVQTNSVCMSLGDRKIWYSLHPEYLEVARIKALQWWENFRAQPIPHCTSLYRSRTTLVTYGDDMIIASLDPRPPEVAQLWKDLLGYTVTDGSKNPVIEPKKFEELIFLKRRFVYWSEHNLYVGALEMSSIIKMMLFKKTRTLSNVDHMADMLTGASRELVYHGREQFSRIEPLIELFLATYGPNAYLQVQDYDSHIRDLIAGNFRTWRVDDPEILTY